LFTAPQFLKKRCNHQAKLIFSGFLLLAKIFIDAAAALYAGAMVMHVMFPNIPPVALLSFFYLVTESTGIRISFRRKNQGVKGELVNGYK